MPKETIVSEFYALVRNLRQGYQFINTEDNTINVYPLSKRAFRAVKRCDDTADLEVARVQIIRQAK